ncbi:MAG: glycosyltransferase [Minisyncoccia bacterium]
MDFKLSLIIPTYQKFSFLKETIAELKKNFPQDEIIVIDDGSSDETYKIQEIFAGQIKYLKNQKNQGKGESLRRGFKEASGDFLIFTDDDLPYGIESIVLILEELKKGEKIVIGTRGKFYNDTFYKRILRPFLYLIIRVLLGLKYVDTQCGIKGFQKEIGKRLFDLSFSKGFAIDVEILYLARKLHYPVKTIKVIQKQIAKSTFKMKGIIKMFLEILKIKLHSYKI